VACHFESDWRSQSGFHAGNQVTAPIFVLSERCQSGLTATVKCPAELLSNLVFEGCWSCGDLVGVCGFDSVFERDACDDFREVVKAA
jgi:hypothetical protein